VRWEAVSGKSDGLADETHCAHFSLPLQRATGRPTWVHQETRAATAEAQEGAGAMSKKHMGSSIVDFLKKEGIFEEAQAQAVKEVVAWQLAQAMKKKKISKNRMPRC
jgi:hypothetical protein